MSGIHRRTSRRRSMLLSCVLCLVVNSAGAADRVIFLDDEPQVAVKRVQQVTGRSRDELVATRLSELLLARPPVVVGAGSTEVCQGTPSAQSGIKAGLERADSSMAYFEFVSALAHLDTAEKAIGCLTEPVEPQVAARIYYLRGIIFQSQGKEAAARSAFLQAHLFQPDLTWDEVFPPDARPLFDEAGAQAVREVPVTLHVVPSPEPGALQVNGKAANAEGGKLVLAPGRHLVQLGTTSMTTFRVNLEGGSGATLVVPAAIPPDAVTWVRDDARRPALSQTLAAVLGENVLVYVTVHEGVWKGATATDAWQELKAPQPLAEVQPTSEPQAGALAEAPAPSRSGGSGGGRLLVVGGSGMTVGGLALTGFSYQRGKQAYRDVNNADGWYAYQQAESRFVGSQRRLYLGAALGTVGLASLGGGILLDGGALVPPGRLVAGPRIGADHAGVVLTWRER
ncbi:MAG: hypothetical protein QGG40_11205 [Myxococcota bacterium]|nr:hypothetical protein [Myxococcota bacterium]